jgi:hypothetical protein
VQSGRSISSRRRVVKPYVSNVAGSAPSIKRKQEYEVFTAVPDDLHKLTCYGKLDTSGINTKQGIGRFIKSSIAAAGFGSADRLNPDAKNERDSEVRKLGPAVSMINDAPVFLGE